VGCGPDKAKSSKIIDRTVPEIFCRAGKTSRLDVIDLFWMLKESGVGLIEINSDILKKLEKLPSGIDFIFRVASEDGADACIKHDIKNCLLTENMLQGNDMVKKLACAGREITVEFEVDSLDRLYDISKLKKSEALSFIRNIRITGLGNFIALPWVDAVGQLRRDLGKGVDVCPVNTYYVGTATAVEAYIHKMDFITVSFAGYGVQHGYGALEELLASIKLLLKSDAGINLKMLPEMTRLFKKMTGVVLPDVKPLIGRNIFKYESGIHADGIEKDPSLYEPFEPGIVGQKRQLIIGKHSGTRSIVKKLEELGISCSKEEAASILEAVRNRSIKLGRALCDDDIREILGAAAIHRREVRDGSRYKNS